LALGLGVLALAILRRVENEGKVKGGYGLFRRYPFVSISIIILLIQSIEILPEFNST